MPTKQTVKPDAPVSDWDAPWQEWCLWMHTVFIDANKKAIAAGVPRQLIRAAILKLMRATADCVCNESEQ